MNEFFKEVYVPGLQKFISIPNLSRSYDENYFTNGLYQIAIKHVMEWVNSLKLKGLNMELLEPEGDKMTPLIYVEVDATNTDND